MWRKGLIIAVLLLLGGWTKIASGASYSLQVRTLRPTSISHIYFSIRNQKGQRVAYRKISGSRAHRPITFNFSLREAGKIRLETSLGKFTGYAGGGQVNFSHPYLRQEGPELVILNHLSLKLKLKTLKPVRNKRIRYLFLTNGGLVIKKYIPGATSHQPETITVSNIIPCYGHLSTSFGQFVIQITNQPQVFFVFQGRKSPGGSEAPIPHTDNILLVRGEVKKGVQKATGGGGSIDFDLPPKVEANESKGARIALQVPAKEKEGRREFTWTYPGGRKRGAKVEVFLPLGEHQILLTARGEKGKLQGREITRVVDTQPPVLSGGYRKVPFPGRNFYGLKIEVRDLCDPQPRKEILLPLPLGFHERVRLEKGRPKKLDFSRSRPYLRAPNPQAWLKALVLEGGVVLTDEDRFDVRPSREPFEMEKKGDHWLWTGQVPPLLLKARDHRGNETSQKLPFGGEIEAPKTEKAEKSTAPEEEAGIAPWKILLSVVLSFLLVALLFHRREEPL